MFNWYVPDPTPAGAGIDRRSPIVREAASLFAQKGYRGTSMRDIGKAIGVHAGSLYVHIDSKEDLLLDIVESIMERSERDMEAVLSAGGTATEQLREIAVRDLTLIGENREFATVFFHEWRNLDADRQQDVIASRDRWEAGLRRVITRGIDEGEFRPVDIRLAGIALTSILNWSYVWYSPDGDFAAADIAEQFVDVLVRGLSA